MVASRNSVQSPAVLKSKSGASRVGFISALSGAIRRTVQSKFRERVSLLDFDDTVNDGVTDADAAIALALATGKDIEVPEGTYLCSGIHTTVDYQSIHFLGKVTLKAKANDVILFKSAASFAKHSGRFYVDCNTHTGVWGIVCGPEDLTQTTAVVQNNFNHLPYIMSNDQLLEEAVVFQCGPDVGGVDSGCFYNKLPGGVVNGPVRAMWFKNPPNAGGASPNRNKVYNFRVGTSGGVSPNTGLQIDAGDTNNFYSCDFEGVGSGAGRAGPNATETGIVVKGASSVNGADNNHNKFYGGHCEACVRDIENENARSEFYGLGYADSKVLFTAEPLISLGGADASALNQRALGFKQTDANTTVFTGTALGDDGHTWRNHHLTTANVTHVGGAAVTAIGEYQSRYFVLGGMVYWAFRMRFQAANNNDLLIDLPLAAEANLYKLYSTIPPMKFSVYTHDGVTLEHSQGLFESASDQVRFTHSSAWDTGGSNNYVYCMCLIYHKA